MKRLFLIVWIICLAGCSPVEDPTLFPAYDSATAEGPPPKPAVEYNPNRHLLWGDLHIHTSYSMDAYILGVRATPDDAYTFARGGTIEHAAGYPIRIDRPLDFAAVTEHSDYMGVARVDDSRTLALDERDLRTRLLNDGPLSLAWATLRSIRHVMTMLDYYAQLPDTRAIEVDAWKLMVETAEAHYQPGVFTTLVGYEWTSTPDGLNLHRNVIYRDTNVPELPYTSVESYDPEDLWDVLDAERAAGMTMLAIPHNGNLSNGLMYDRVAYDGSPMTAQYAQQRMRNEPLSEMLQIKGTGETHPLLSPEDEFADFELFTDQFTGGLSEPRGSYTRDALRAGIEMAHAENFNPYRFGVIGSSDSHNASTSVEEGRHHGKLPLMDGTAAIRLGEASLLPKSMQRSRRWGAAGLAAVWATENTREAVYDALSSKETYATSGPRILLRFFGSFDYDQSLLQDKDLLQRAYADGVPMGGTLPQAPPDQNSVGPQFLLWAASDPEGANLDRLQIIKGWVDADGQSHEAIFDVALSDDRNVGKDGRVKPVGNTVDVATATYNNSIGTPQLQAFWSDPAFDPEQEAFYYARAIEIPTPRWSTFDAMRLGVEAPEPTSIQERAISSAIWYPATQSGASPGN